MWKLSFDVEGRTETSGQYESINVYNICMQVQQDRRKRASATRARQSTQEEENGLRVDIGYGIAGMRASQLHVHGLLGKLVQEVGEHETRRRNDRLNAGPRGL